MDEPASGKLLLVDDVPVNTDLLSRIFRRQGYETSTVNDSGLVLDAIAAFKPDILIMDVMMPGKDGYELTREIKSHRKWRHIPIMLLSALTEREARTRGMEAGADEFVIKPFSRVDLLDRVANLLERKTKALERE